ncbi:DUF4116 domain-containing protein [Endozoicomonas sp. ISHI1]|uniref:DUF4116 domain-containing protein n=2 Tax=unclassified Endozoicomonas TaxID=2644528 RepID=UPI002148E43E|nr:DUF4116 domain-containing protein [Endozoicomonas sp. ISHI1]
MLSAGFDKAYHPILTKNPTQETEAGSSFKSQFGGPDISGVPIDETPLAKRFCSACSLSSSEQAADYSPASRKQLGGKGMFLQLMQQLGLSVPPFKCVTAQVMQALEQHPLDSQSLTPYLPEIAAKPWTECSLIKIREYLSTLPPSEQNQRDEWLAGLASFVASNDFYEQVKDSEAARHIRNLRGQLDEKSISQPVIVRSSGINEDNYGDAQAGKYLSEVQGEEDVLRTCLKVMASGYRPEVCPQGIPQPMALIIQHCIDCRYGGVVMSFKSFQDNTVRVEYTPGQPRGAVAGQSGNTPHRIDISRKEETDSWQYFPGTVSSRFILQKNTDNNGYSEAIIHNTDGRTDDGGLQLTDDMASELRKMVAKLEDLLLCPVDVEFAIDFQGGLFPLQVRPITRLTGGMDFAMPMPEGILATGEVVSEGYCTGSLWLAKKGEADTMPKGAIIVANHAEKWMLEPEFLKRAGGFVFAEGGFNDHVAILMRQEEKTLMLAGEQFAAMAAQGGQRVTLACARFNGQPGAFIVVGDMTEKMVSHRSLFSAVSDVPSAKSVPSRDDLSLPEGTFGQVGRGFQWLTDQNARLLSFFAPGGGLDCLANPIKLSMSPQRSKILAETRENVNRLIHGAEALLEGYDAFLRLAVKKCSREVQSLRDEFPELSNRFKTLKESIQSKLESIILPMQAAEEGQVSRREFLQWVADCQQLQSSLQALNPGEAEQVRSVHELIFALHQRFVNALAPVSLASGQGRLSEEKLVTYVDFTTLVKSGEKAMLLSPSGKAVIEKLRCSEITVVSMDDALIVNLLLGRHTSVIELLENAEGGKGRTLRLKFSDEFEKPDGSGQPGKLQRMWFLVQLLRVIELDKHSDGMQLSCNAVAGEIIIECPRMTSTPDMLDAFEKLITALGGLEDLDIFLRRAFFEGERCNFNWLAERLDSDVASEANRFDFQHGLFTIVYNSLCIDPRFYSLLSNHQQFIHHVKRLRECRRKSDDELQKLLMSDEIAEDKRRELLQHFLLINTEIGNRLVVLLYPHLEGQFFVIKTPCSGRLEFDVPPVQTLGNDKEKFRNTLLKNGLEYASQRVLNDRDLILPAISKHPDELKYVSEELRDDREVVIASVAREGNQLQYASSKLKGDKKVVMAAVKNYPRALRYASEKNRGDKDIIQIATDGDMHSLHYATETILNDREYMLDLIQRDALAFTYAAKALKNDEAFVEAARKRNPEVSQHIRNLRIV